MHSRKIKLVVGSLFVIGVTALPSTAAFAEGKGPGGCVVPGSVISQIAKDDGPIAGPNNTFNWGTAPDAPNTPGQGVKFQCH